MDTNIRREQRAGLIATARGIVDGAEADSRPLTSEEQEQIDRVFADADALHRTIEKEEQVAAAEAEMRSFHRRTINDPVVETADAGEVRATATPEYRKAFGTWLRHNDTSEMRALTVGAAAAGGNIVDDEMAAQIVAKADEMSFVRGLSNVLTTNSDMKIPVESTKVAATIVAEAAAYDETDPAWGSTTLSSFKLSTLVKVSEELLHDSEFDLQGWLSNAFGRAFGVAEDQYFLNGSGSSQPRGVLNTASINSKTAAGDDTVTSSELIEVYHNLPNEYRMGGSIAWFAKDSTIAMIRKLKDLSNGADTGNYMWQPGLQAGQPDMLLGHPIYANANVPAMTTGLKAIGLCNFDYFYIADRGSISVQRLDEIYAGNGQVGFRAHRRFDGALVQADAGSILTMG